MVLTKLRPYGAITSGEKGIWLTTVHGEEYAIVYTHGTCVDLKAVGGAACFFGYGCGLSASYPVALSPNRNMGKPTPKDIREAEERCQWTATMEGLETLADECVIRRCQVRTTAKYVVKFMKESFADLEANDFFIPEGKNFPDEDLLLQMSETLEQFDHVDWVLLDDRKSAGDLFRLETERTAKEEATYWRDYFRTPGNNPIIISTKRR